MYTCCHFFHTVSVYSFTLFLLFQIDFQRSLQQDEATTIESSAPNERYERKQSLNNNNKKPIKEVCEINNETAVVPCIPIVSVIIALIKRLIFSSKLCRLRLCSQHISFELKEKRKYWLDKRQISSTVVSTWAIIAIAIDDLSPYELCAIKHSIE